MGGLKGGILGGGGWGGCGCSYVRRLYVSPSYTQQRTWVGGGGGMGGWGCNYVVLYVSPSYTQQRTCGGGGRGGCKYVRCRVTMHLDYAFLLKVEGHFLLRRGFTQVAKGDPCRNWYINARVCVCIYIYMCVNKHSVADQDFEIERGVLASVVFRPHIDDCRGFSFLGLPFL